MLDRIARLADGGASGELIVVSDAIEIHVYFQKGRIAWATDAARPLAFTRRLLERAQIDVDVFREILESCRREKRPVGETLVAWGVATLDQVREALQHQIVLVLAVLEEVVGVESLFLKRSSQFADYDTTLTFGLEQLLTKSPTSPPVIPRLPSIAPVAGASPSAVTRLRAMLEGTLWVGMLEGATAVEWFRAQNDGEELPTAVVEQTLLDGASMVVFRSATRTLAGVALSPSLSLWCLVDGSMSVGAVTSTLASFQASERALPSPEPATDDGRLWVIGSANERVEKATREFLARAPEIHGIFTTDPAHPSGTFGVGRKSVTSSDLASLVERRARAVAVHAGVRGAALPGPDSDGQTSYRAMTAEAGSMLYAAEILVGEESRFVWIAVDRSCSKGIGWGYLTSLGRTLGGALRSPQMT